MFSVALQSVSGELRRCISKTLPGSFWQLHASVTTSSTICSMQGRVITQAPAGPTTPVSSIPGLRVTPWKQQQLEQRYPPLKSDIETQVCVVGAGIAGLTTAYRLAKAGKEVVVLESRVRAGGVTGRDAGHVVQWSNEGYRQVEQRLGAKTARLVAQSHDKAVDWVRSVVAEENIDCDFEMVPGYLFPHEDNSVQLRNLQEELRACERAELVDLAEVDLGGKSDASTGRVTSALKFPKCAQLDPVKFTEGLAKAVEKHGGHIYEGMRVKSGPQGGLVRTMNGPSVRASLGVVLATHTPLNRNQIWVHNRQLPQRTYFIACEIPKGSVQRSLFWDTSEAPHTVRVCAHPDGSSSGKELLLVGGERHQQGQAESTFEDYYGRLQRWAKGWFPQCGELVYAWSTTDYYPADMLGLYGHDPVDFSNNYIITGTSGQNLTGSIVGASVVSEALLGRRSPFHDIYDPNRVLPTVTTGLPGVLRYFANLGTNFSRYLVPRGFRDVQGCLLPSSLTASLKPGQGTVAQLGWRKVALYKDENGTVHKRSAVCTHLGCMVEWNPKDACFDCMCHGSQFDPLGRCVHGPAVVDLEDLGK